MKRAWEIFVNGIITENPILIIMIGLCPTLACSSSATDALGMGIAATVVLVCSNIMVSFIRAWVPSEIRIPIFIIIIAAFVTVVDYLMQAYTPALSQSLGVFVPLIVVNCVILGRAEAFAYKNTVWHSLIDALGMGVGLTVAIVLLGVIREVLGAGKIFGHVLPLSSPATIMILPPGAFIAIGVLVCIWNKMRKTNSRAQTTCTECALAQLCHPAAQEKCEVLSSLENKK